MIKTIFKIENLRTIIFIEKVEILISIILIPFIKVELMILMMQMKLFNRHPSS